MINRRRFLKNSLGLAAAGFGATILRPYLAWGQTVPAGTVKNVILFYLDGGVDALYTWPFKTGPLSDYLATVRTNQNLNRDAIIEPPGQSGLPNRLGLHENWSSLYSTVNAGSGGVLLLKNLGTPWVQDGSHNGAYNNISIAAGSSSTGENRGWFGRTMDAFSMQSMQAWVPSPTANIPDFRASVGPLAVSDFSLLRYPVRFGSYGGSSGALDSAYVNELIMPNLVSLESSGNEARAALRVSMTQIDQVVSAAQSILDQPTQGTYATGSNLSRALQSIVRILRFKQQSSELQNQPSLFYVSQGGFDTHGSTPANLITNMSQSLRGLVQDLRSMGEWESSVIVLVSEFARTTRQNGSQAGGTDHAWGGTSMILGGRVRSGVTMNPDPPLSELQTRNSITPTLNIQAPLAAVIQAMGGTAAASSVFPGFDLAQANQLNIFV